jgi:hypothetical protein
MSEKTTVTRSVPEVAKVLTQNVGKILQLTFFDGDEFVLTNFREIDSSIYDEKGGRTATIVKAIRGKHPRFNKLFLPNGELDFLEQDVTKIEDVTLGTVLYKC